MSRNDEIQGESNSITNQKQYLEDYAVQNGFENIRHFSDDGYSGTNFNRPAFNALLAEIEAGRVGTVIDKGMSRFGSNSVLDIISRQLPSQLAEHKQYQVRATLKSYRKMCNDALNGDPIAKERYEKTLAKRREVYHAKKNDQTA